MEQVPQHQYDIFVYIKLLTQKVAAALISLINYARLATGSPPLGFLNPWLYDVF